MSIGLFLGTKMLKMLIREQNVEGVSIKNIEKCPKSSCLMSYIQCVMKINFVV